MSCAPREREKETMTHELDRRLSVLFFVRILLQPCLGHIGAPAPRICTDTDTAAAVYHMGMADMMVSTTDTHIIRTRTRATAATMGDGPELPIFNMGTLSAFLAWFGGTGYLATHYYGAGF